MRSALTPLLLILLAAEAYSLDETAIYRASDIESAGGGLMWRDTAGHNNLQLADPTGVTIGDPPEVGDDGGSAVFSGQQTAPFRTIRSAPVPTTALKVNLAFKPEDTSDKKEQTLLRQGNWEVRYAPETKRLLFIVWHDSKNYTMLAAPAETGAWQEVKAAYEEGMMKLEVNGVPKTVEAKGPLGTHHAASALFVGAYPGEDYLRSVCGAMADIRISAQ